MRRFRCRCGFLTEEVVVCGFGVICTTTGNPVLGQGGRRDSGGLPRAGHTKRASIKAIVFTTHTGTSQSGTCSACPDTCRSPGELSTLGRSSPATLSAIAGFGTGSPARCRCAVVQTSRGNSADLRKKGKTNTVNFGKGAMI